jgi:hypothetical protein
LCTSKKSAISRTWLRLSISDWLIIELVQMVCYW